MALLSAGRTRAIAAIVVAAAASAWGAPASEYEVKAAFLYNFARFVEWPPDAIGPAPAPFVIGVLGADPFGDTLDRTMAGKAVGGHPVQVRRLDDPEAARQVHILFVSSSERDRLRTIVKSAGRSTLIVGETSDFARSGGMIGFRVDDRRVRFEINPARAEEAHLKVSSQLLKLATIVRGDE